MGDDPKALERTPLSPRVEEISARGTMTLDEVLQENARLRRELEEALSLAARDRDERRISELLKHSAVPEVTDPPSGPSSVLPPNDPAFLSIRATERAVKRLPVRFFLGVLVLVLEHVLEHLLSGH